MENNAKRNKKRVIIGIVVGILAVALVIGAIYGIKSYNMMFNYEYEGDMYSSKEEVYDYFNQAPDEVFSYDLDSYSRKFEKLEKALDSRDEELINALSSAEELSAEYTSIIENADKSLVGFFADEFGISVDGEMQKLKVKVLELSEEQSNITGLYYSKDDEIGTDGFTIYINKVLLIPEMFEDTDYGKEQLYSLVNTYIHETIHYLGGSTTSDEDDISYNFFIEGLTEALTEDVLVYSGYEYENETKYIHNKALAEQLIIANEDFIEFMFEGEVYRSPEEVDKYFDANSIEGMGDNIDRSILLIMYTEYCRDYDKKYHLMAQYYMGEYLKYQELTEEEMIEIADRFIAPISELTQ